MRTNKHNDKNKDKDRNDSRTYSSLCMCRSSQVILHSVAEVVMRGPAPSVQVVQKKKTASHTGPMCLEELRTYFTKLPSHHAIVTVGSLS